MLNAKGVTIFYKCRPHGFPHGVQSVIQSIELLQKFKEVHLNKSYKHCIRYILH